MKLQNVARDTRDMFIKKKVPATVYFSRSSLGQTGSERETFARSCVTKKKKEKKGKTFIKLS